MVEHAKSSIGAPTRSSASNHNGSDEEKVKKRRTQIEHLIFNYIQQLAYAKLVNDDGHIPRDLDFGEDLNNQPIDGGWWQKKVK